MFVLKVQEAISIGGFHRLLGFRTICSVKHNAIEQLHSTEILLYCPKMLKRSDFDIPVLKGLNDLKLYNCALLLIKSCLV